MFRSSRLLWAAALLLPLGACDRDYGPGIDHYNDSFAAAPPASRVDTDRDSVSGGGKAYQPVGTTSGARTVAEAVSSQPGGDPNTSKYTNSGTTDGSSTTSGRSLTNRGTTDTEKVTSGKAATSPGGTANGQTTDGRGSLNNVPRQKVNTSKQGVVDGPKPSQLQTQQAQQQ